MAGMYERFQGRSRFMEVGAGKRHAQGETGTFKTGQTVAKSGVASSAKEGGQHGASARTLL